MPRCPGTSPASNPDANRGLDLHYGQTRLSKSWFGSGGNRVSSCAARCSPGPQRLGEDHPGLGGEHGRGRWVKETEGAVLAVARAVLFLYTTVVNKLPWHFFCFLTICAVSCVRPFFFGGVGWAHPSVAYTGKGKGTRGERGNKGGRQHVRQGDGSVLSPCPKQPQPGGTAADLGSFGPPALSAPCTRPCAPGARRGDALPPHTQSRELEPNFCHVLGDEELAAMGRKRGGRRAHAKVYAEAR